ncbi:hypothetical protein chiPu_0029172, partial [Chiloscyllium punctatum]|nr:hypothetical protein [Chiloscyllium punctatum]
MFRYHHNEWVAFVLESPRIVPPIELQLRNLSCRSFDIFLIQPDLITLDPTKLGQVDFITMTQKHQERVQRLVRTSPLSQRPDLRQCGTP